MGGQGRVAESPIAGWIQKRYLSTRHSVMETQAEIAALAEALYREKVQRAREQDPCEKLVDGFRMFESALEFTKAGVAATLKTNDESAIMQGLLNRFERIRKVREAGLYEPVVESIPQ